jgi:hypothetical protein
MKWLARLVAAPFVLVAIGIRLVPRVFWIVVDAIEPALAFVFVYVIVPFFRVLDWSITVWGLR